MTDLEYPLMSKYPRNLRMLEMFVSWRLITMYFNNPTPSQALSNILVTMLSILDKYIYP
jgi:hypothetical protein